ncbi:unnamed protein product, partial [Didymodactylos carnosus]
DGAKAIATALITNQTLTTLDLGYNQISDDGAKAIATALITNHTLLDHSELEFIKASIHMQPLMQFSEFDLKKEQLL